MAVDLMPKRNFVEQIHPNLASSIGFNAGLNAWGAWTVGVPANIPNDFVLHAIHYMWQYVCATAFPFTAVTYHIQVGTGAAGAEVPVAQGSSGLFLWVSASGVNVYAGTGTTMWFEPVVIPSGTRVALRAWCDHAANAPQFGAYLVGYDARDYEISSELLVRPHDRYIKGICSPTQGAVCFPGTGFTNVNTGGVAWTWGNWTQFVAAAANDILVTGITSFKPQMALLAQAQVGIGPAGSEVAAGQVGLAGRTFGGWATSYLPRPAFIKRAERISIRTAGSFVNHAVPIVIMAHEVK